MTYTGSLKLFHFSLSHAAASPRKAYKVVKEAAPEQDEEESFVGEADWSENDDKKVRLLNVDLRLVLWVCYWRAK